MADFLDNGLKQDYWRSKDVGFDKIHLHKLSQHPEFCDNKTDEAVWTHT